MKTLKQLERALKCAEDKSFEWYCQYDGELQWLYTRNAKGRYMSLKKFYGAADNVSARIEQDKVDVYEKGENSRYEKCTRRAVARLRTLERKVDRWNNLAVAYECAINDFDENPDEFLRNMEQSGVLKEFDTLGISIR